MSKNEFIDFVEVTGGLHSWHFTFKDFAYHHVFADDKPLSQTEQDKLTAERIQKLIDSMNAEIIKKIYDLVKRS